MTPNEAQENTAYGWPLQKQVMVEIFQHFGASAIEPY
jgi:hypothetical protein